MGGNVRWPYRTRAARFEKALAAKQYVAAAGLAECLGDAGRESDAADLFERTIAKAEESAAVSLEDLLTMREKLAWCVGEKVGGQGDPKRALDIIRQVARDSAAIYGDTHTETLNARINLARQTGAAGNPQEALAIAGEVVADATQFLGPDHRATLSARFEVAVWARRADGSADAVQLFGELLKYMESLEHANLLILDCAWNLGGALIDSGDPAAALPVLDAALQECEQVYGKKYCVTLNMRLTHADAVGGAGEPNKAAQLASQLVEDCSRVLGDRHPTTVESRRTLARWTAEAYDE